MNHRHCLIKAAKAASVAVILLQPPPVLNLTHLHLQIIQISAVLFNPAMFGKHSELNTLPSVG